jgi:hypothetical protein
MSIYQIRKILQFVYKWLYNGFDTSSVALCAVVVLGARKDFKTQAAPAQDDPEFHGNTVSLGQDALVSCSYDTDILR